MRLFRARSVSPLLRLFALALLVLGVLVAPVASALGDVHALEHSLDRLDAGHVHESPTADPGDEAGELLHALMHSGHCHGHATVLMPVLGWQPLLQRTAPQRFGAAVDYRSRSSATLLRPPIAA